ncbi:hypothetical protein LSUE1_G010335, partial [Lachnellula suecica]
MSAQSLKRKTSVAGFMETKWLKLGVPVVVYTIFGPPAIVVVARVLRGQSVDFLSVLVSHLKGTRSVKGPLWYPALLLVFDTTHALLPQLSMPIPGFWPTTLLTISSSFLLQAANPLHLNALLAPLSVQPAYFPQYTAAYILGALSTPASTLLTPARRNTLFSTSILSGTYLGYLLRHLPSHDIISSLTGHYNTLTLTYAIWNNTTGLLLGSSLLALFEEKEWAGRRWGSMGRYSYAAFLVHPIVCVGICVAAERWRASGLVKTG